MHIGGGMQCGMPERRRPYACYSEDKDPRSYQRSEITSYATRGRKISVQGETISRVQAKAWSRMVALQQPLHPVHDPGVDQFLRCRVQPNLHLRTIALRLGGERQCPHSDEESGNHHLQRVSFAVYTIPRANVVLSDWQSPADQVRKNDE